MNIIIKDDQGLDTALMMDGYSREERIEAKQTIRAQFRDTASKVFKEILGKPLPETMIVNMCISDNEELKGETAARLASYSVVLSRAIGHFRKVRDSPARNSLRERRRSSPESSPSARGGAMARIRSRSRFRPWK